MPAQSQINTGVFPSSVSTKFRSAREFSLSHIKCHRFIDDMMSSQTAQVEELIPETVVPLKPCTLATKF